MNSKEIREAAKFMDEQFKGQAESDRQYNAKVISESEKLEELVAQVRKAQEDGTMFQSLFFWKSRFNIIAKHTRLYLMC